MGSEHGNSAPTKEPRSHEVRLLEHSYIKDGEQIS